MIDKSLSMQLRLDNVVRLINTVTNDADDLVKKPLKQTLINSGKLLRPSLLLWAASCGGSSNKDSVVSVASALELLHISTLIHDDVIDKGTTRRGLPCVHSLFGNSVAVYTGDYIIVKCFQLLHDTGNDNLIYDFVMASEKLCKAEIIQYQSKEREIKESTYITIAKGKTGALFALAMSCGARLAGFGEDVCIQFAELGEQFGIAFQIADDCIDYLADGKSGKSSMADVKQGLYNMPMILALKSDDGSLRQLLGSEKNPKNIDSIRDMVILLGGIEAAKKEIISIISDCRVRLGQLPIINEDSYFSSLLDSMEEKYR